MALMRVYCGLAASEPIGTKAGKGWLSVAIVDDAGRLLDVCDIGDDAVGYAELGALLAERSGGSVNVAVAADTDEHHITLLLAAAGRPMAIVDEELLSDYADRFGDDDSTDELDAGPSERQSVGLARALAAGALTAASQSAPRELMALKPVLSAHAAMAAGRHGTAVALREVLRELYPAALRAYPDPAETIPLAILDALPEPGLLGASTAGRGRDAAVVAQLAAAGVADATTITDALTALRVAIAETPRRTGIGKGTTTAVAETIREAVAAVRACDSAISALVGLLAEKGTAVPARPIAVLPHDQHAEARSFGIDSSRQPARRRPTVVPVREVESPAASIANPAAATRTPIARPIPARSIPRQAPAASAQMPSTAPTGQVPVGQMPAAQMPAAQMPAATQRPTAAMPPAPMPAPQMPAAQMPAAHMSAAQMPAGAVPPPPPGITPIAPSLPMRNAPVPPPQQQPVAPAAAMQTPVMPSWAAADPIVNYSTGSQLVPQTYQSPLNGYDHAAGAGPHAGYGFDPGHDAAAFPLAPEFPAPGSRETWPLNPPSYDEDAVRARTGSFSYQQAPVPSETPIPRQRVAPPWQGDDIQLPLEPPSLRLIDRDSQREAERELPATPALRLVGREEPPMLNDERAYTSPMDDSDGDLLIFAQAARSAWFEWPDEAEPERPAWTDIDAGWSAAEKVEHPEVGGQTEVGLPRRVPQANLVPGSPLPPMIDAGLRIVRDPASMAAHTTGYFRGSRRGEEVRGYAVGGRQGRESGGGWDFSRDGWDSDRDSGYRSAAHR